MLRAKTNRRSFRIQGENFEEPYAFVENLLMRKDVTEETAKETLLVFEALLQRLVDWGLSKDTDLDISGEDRLGEFRIRAGFEGKMFTRGDDAVFSIEDRILDAHDDKLDYGYFSGYNVISISVNRSYSASTLACMVASLLAVIVYLPLSFFADASVQEDLLANYVFPLETVYGNAMLMIGAPMTFFSLLKNLTNTYVVSQRSSGTRRLQVETLATSVFSILLAFAIITVMSIVLLPSFEGTSSTYGGYSNRTFADVVTSLVPSSIFDAFEAISPMPLIGVTLLCTYALCSAGKYFEPLRHAMMACYTLFSRMLHVVIAALPVFCFLAIMDTLLDTGLEGTAEVIIMVASIYLGILLLLATYAIRLRANGIRVIPFVRKLTPLLRENSSIGSAINAAPYNIRFCARTLKMNREMLERSLPVLAEINLDGNCFILTSLALMFTFATSTDLSWISLIGLGMLILFLSYGAPNQPGSILIGTLIITMYLNSFEMVGFAIFSEAFLGSAQNLINVIGDIVMVAIEDSKEKARAEA